MKVRLERGDFGTFLLKPVMQRGKGFKASEELPDSILIQTDWDFPGVAMNLGWQPCCSLTDGTIDCPHGEKTASEMIAEAGEYLDKSIGESFEDPGYFA